MPETAPSGIDTSRPNVARVYDFLLGGKDNFAADRELAGQLLAQDPNLSNWVRQNRAFVCAAAARAAREGGITQFIDLGAGLPTHPAVHDAVRHEVPDARVVYVDNDAVAVLHAQALLPKDAGLTAFQADLTDPGSVLGNPRLTRVVDTGRPVGIILGLIAHFLPGLVMRAATADYVSAASAGSWLIISAGRSEEDAYDEEIGNSYSAAQTYRHTLEEFTSFFDGTSIVSPGIGEAKRWISGLEAPPPSRGLYVMCGAGVKE